MQEHLLLSIIKTKAPHIPTINNFIQLGYLWG